jgi:hypothetical protein
MIVNNSYFVGEIFIPHSKSDISDSVIGANESVKDFIDEYESDCLSKSLGYSLYKLFKDELDDTQSNGLKVTADSKWNDLLNGKEYVLNTETLKWRGIRYSNNNGSTYKSFLANYIYFHYLKDYQSRFSSVGVQQSTPQNANIVTSFPKAVNSWRRFVKLVQGNYGLPSVIENYTGYGIDWYGSSSEITLYQFIYDMNKLVPGTYPNFNPYLWVNINEFQI